MHELQVFKGDVQVKWCKLCKRQPFRTFCTEVVEVTLFSGCFIYLYIFLLYFFFLIYDCELLQEGNGCENCYIVCCQCSCSVFICKEFLFLLFNGCVHSYLILKCNIWSVHFHISRVFRYCFACFGKISVFITQSCPHES